MLTCANIVLKDSDWSNIKSEDDMVELYNKAYHDTKECYLKLVKERNETLSKLRKSEV